MMGILIQILILFLVCGFLLWLIEKLPWAANLYWMKRVIEGIVILIFIVWILGGTGIFGSSHFPHRW